MHSRQSAGYFDIPSNGHCRSDGANAPCVRMGNIFVESEKKASSEQLEEDLINECEKQGREYGLILKGSVGEMTLPSESYYQTYPSHVFRLYRDGTKERVRGIYVVGTPYQTLMNILETGDK